MEAPTAAAGTTAGANRVKRTPDEVKQLLLAYLSGGEQWPEDVNSELRKYYRRTYINPAGPKHHLFKQWRKEWERTSGITYIQKLWTI